MSDASAKFSARIGPAIPAPKPAKSYFGVPAGTLLLLGAIVVLVLVGIGLGVRASIERDEAAHRAAETTVGSVVDALQRDVAELLSDYVSLVGDPDMADLLAGSARRAALISRWVTRYSEVDIALVADRSGRYLQMAESGQLRPPTDIAEIQRDLAAFVGPWLQRQPLPGTTLTGIVEVRGLPVAVAAAPLKAPAGGGADAADQPAYLIALRYLERDMAKMLEREFGFIGVKLVRAGQEDNHHTYPVPHWDGKAPWVATWTSDPEHQGSLPWAPLALVLPIGLAAGGLVWHLRKSAEGEKQVIETKSAEVLAGEKLLADIRTGIRQLSWNLSEGVVLIEGAAEVRYANAAAARLVGRGAETLLGTSFAEACRARFPALADHLADYVATDPRQWSGDASWFSTVGTDGRMIKVGIHEFRRGDQGRMIGLLITEAVWNQLGDPLDRIGIGVLCLDADNHLLAANRLASDLCRQLKAPLDASGEGGLVPGRVLDLIRPGLERLKDAPVASLPLLQPDSPEPVVATLIRMAGGDNPAETGGLFVLLRDPGRAMTADPALLAELFGMTPAECRVAIRTAAGASAEALAEELGLSPHTIRNHLKSVMRKTSTSKQPETVALLWRLAAYTGESRGE